MLPRTKLQDLPDALLSQIALAADTHDRRTLLPVLSKRWAGLLQGPDAAWENVSINRDDESFDEATPNATAMAAWFGRRAGAVRRLYVCGTLFRNSPFLPASLLATILTTQSGSLRRLRLDVATSRLNGPDLAVLAVLTGLEELYINLPEEPRLACWDDHCASVIATLSRLPALKTLELGSYKSTADAVLPTVSELAALCSPTLSVLGVALASPPEGTLILGTMPALDVCSIVAGHYEEIVLHVTPASFSGATGLRKLRFSDHGELRLAPRCFSNLSMLVDLDLGNCGLKAVPAALSGLQQTLRVLGLGRNTKLQIDQAGFDTLLALPALKRLNLQKSWKPEEAAQWTVQSVGFLVRFLIEWQDLWPEASRPALRV